MHKSARPGKPKINLPMQILTIRRRRLPITHLYTTNKKRKTIRIIVGDPLPSRKGRGIKGGIHGKHGVMELKFDNPDVAKVFRELPSKAQGKGIGTVLLQIAETVAHENGAKVLVTRTNNNNMAAIKTYEKNDWVKYGEDQNGVYYKKSLKK